MALTSDTDPCVVRFIVDCSRLFSCSASARMEPVSCTNTAICASDSSSSSSSSLTAPLSHASQRRLPFQGMSYRLFVFVFFPPLHLSFFLCFPSLLSVSFHPGRPPKYSSVPELGSLTPTSPSSPVHPLPLPSPSSGDVSNDGGDGQFRGLNTPSHTVLLAQ